MCVRILSGRSLSNTLCPVEPYRMPHRARQASPYDDHTGVDRFGWGASHMQEGENVRLFLQCVCTVHSYYSCADRPRA